MLLCHPETRTQAVRGIEARVRLIPGRSLDVNYLLKGDLARLKIPSVRTPHRGDHLWRHTCFEAFLAGKGRSSYYEFNFAPSGEWAAYFFRDYRDGGSPVAKNSSPSVTVHSAEGFLALDATIPLDHFTEIDTAGMVRLALSSVVEDDHGLLSYWALKHPPGKPDFHHPDAFALEIEPAQPDGQ